MKFFKEVKKGIEITILMRKDLQKNSVNVKQTDIVFRFVDVFSENNKVNELLCYISYYLQAKELSVK